jgi:AraC-like DNA-binding protein
MIHTIFPHSPLLQKYIDCYYILNKENPSRLSYLVFPHYNTGLSFLKGVDIQREGTQVEIIGNSRSKVSIELVGKYLNPLRIKYSGRVQEISIIFKPFGINRFLRDDYHSLAAGYSQEFKNQTWRQIGEALFNKKDPIVHLESFLLSELREESEINEIERSLALLHHTEKNYAISDIAKQLGYNLKTFQRHFFKHMACTPVEYRRIIRFRSAIESKFNKKELKTLTDVTFENNYFDQSYFIKEFKKLTHHSPKKFFKVVKQLDGEKIIWEIL